MRKAFKALDSFGPVGPLFKSLGMFAHHVMEVRDFRVDGSISGMPRGSTAVLCIAFCAPERPFLPANTRWDRNSWKRHV